jgi:hypothetical protein
MAKGRYVPATDFATVLAGLGDVDGAIEVLERAVAERCLFLSWARVWPAYESLRGEMRFESVAEELRLPGTAGEKYCAFAAIQG